MTDDFFGRRLQPEKLVPRIELRRRWGREGALMVYLSAFLEEWVLEQLAATAEVGA